MNYFELFTYIGLIPLFIFIISIQSVVFWIVCKSKNERKWNKRFYQCVEVFEDSPVDSPVVWSFLTDPNKFMNFNYRNKIKWVNFEQPLRLGSAVRIRIRKGYGFKGFLSCFEKESRIVFEYHVWPNATRYICEIEMIRLEGKTRYILRMKVKKIAVPLIKKLYPRIDERMKKLGSDLLHNCLKICEKNCSEENQ
jgi:Activator of Hsp90 ATPase homolog 1-like protein.